MSNDSELKVLRWQKSETINIIADRGSQTENSCTGASGTNKGDCPQLLNQIWRRQLTRLQAESNRSYAKRHALELSIGRKIFARHQDDQSISTDRVA